MLQQIGSRTILEDAEQQYKIIINGILLLFSALFFFFLLKCWFKLIDYYRFYLNVIKKQYINFIELNGDTILYRTLLIN